LTNNYPLKKLSDFKWENRIVLTFDIPSEEFQKIDKFQFIDRKLLFFQFEDANLHQTNFEGEIDATSFLKLKELYKGEYILIGLDGGVKAYGNKENFSILNLINTIDAMPMRQSEIRKKDNRNY
jgi:hypothetical protein